MKYTVSLSVHGPGGVARDKRVLAADRSETPIHIALKLIGLLLFFEPGLRVEEGIGWHYKPDLLLLQPDGRVRLWVDCGSVAVRKVDRVANKIGAEGRLVLVRQQRGDAQALHRALQGRVRHPGRVELLHFDDGFVGGLAELLEATNEVEASAAHDVLGMVLRNRSGCTRLHTRVYRLPVGAGCARPACIKRSRSD